MLSRRPCGVIQPAEEVKIFFGFFAGLYYVSKGGGSAPDRPANTAEENSMSDWQGCKGEETAMKKPSISPQDREMAIQYLVGATMPALAKDHGVALTAVWFALHQVLQPAAFRPPRPAP